MSRLADRRILVPYLNLEAFRGFRRYLHCLMTAKNIDLDFVFINYNTGTGTYSLPADAEVNWQSCNSTSSAQIVFSRRIKCDTI